MRVNTASDPYVMPSWTTGGTDVICEKETDKSRERECERRRGRQWGDRERERDKGGRERKRDAMRQGYRDERKASLSLHFFNIPSS